MCSSAALELCAPNSNTRMREPSRFDTMLSQPSLPGKRDRPIKLSATDILARRTKKVGKKAKRLRKLDSEQRHKIRIAIKKLRYACDFFESLFTDHRAMKRLSAFQDRLKSIQDCLGALNDIKVHQQLAPKLASGKPSTRGRQRAFAVGVVTGQEQSEIEPLLKAAVKGAKKLGRVEPFWA